MIHECTQKRAKIVFVLKNSAKILLSVKKFESETGSPLGVLSEISSFIEVHKKNSMLSPNAWLNYTNFSDFANFLITFKVFVSIFLLFWKLAYEGIISVVKTAGFEF